MQRATHAGIHDETAAANVGCFNLTVADHLIKLRFAYIVGLKSIFDGTSDLHIFLRSNAAGGVPQRTEEKMSLEMAGQKLAGG